MKKLVRILCISTFAAMPLFAQDAEPKPIDETKEEIVIDDVVDLDETKEEIALDEIAIQEEEITDDIADEISDEVTLNEDKDEEMIG